MFGDGLWSRSTIIAEGCRRSVGFCPPVQSALCLVVGLSVSRLSVFSFGSGLPLVPTRKAPVAASQSVSQSVCGRRPSQYVLLQPGFGGEQPQKTQTLRIWNTSCLGCMRRESYSAKSHWETKGRFRKRLALANVPSFRFSFRGEHANVPSFRFCSGGTSECTLVPVFVLGEHPPKPPFWRTTLLSTPEKGVFLSSNCLLSAFYITPF